MMNKDCSINVLVVDDEPNVAKILADGVERLGEEYNIEIANDGHSALELLHETPYQLIITDYMMPGMNGIDLALAARKISPTTQVVLMTAYGTDNLRDTVNEIELDGYIDKPFTMDQIRKIVERAVAFTHGEDSYRTGQRSLEQPVKEELKKLQANTGARCVMLISSSGYPVETSGQTNGLDITSVGALVAANFAAAAELARLLGKGSVFRSSYHEGAEGTDYNIYAYDTNQELLLVVVFGEESKPGAVWFYTKEAAAALEPLIAADGSTSPFAGPLPLDTDAASGSGDDGKGGGKPLMSVQDAVDQGLLPPEFADQEALGEQISSQLDSLQD
jgi:CheY-like chemotaxis protein/predicted regulator of Ras-like GTPase activity (Roadblock/LC7/MglB family)